MLHLCARLLLFIVDDVVCKRTQTIETSDFFYMLMLLPRNCSSSEINVTKNYFYFSESNLSLPSAAIYLVMLYRPAGSSASEGV